MSRSQGQRAEALALAYLQRAGLRRITQNYHCRGGEIDLICADGDTLIAVEVRYRRNLAYGGAAASVDQHKQARIILATQHYLQRHPQYAERPWRFDVLALSGDSQQPDIHWIKDAFRLE